MTRPTHTKGNNADLHRREALYQASLEALDEGACLCERMPTQADGLRDYRYIWMNSAMQRTFGIGDLSGQSVRDSFPDESEAWHDDYDRVLDTGVPARIIRESESQGMVLEMLVSRVETATDAVLLVVIRNVTDRVRAVEALRESERRMRDVLDGMGEAFGLMDHDLRIITQNDAALRLDGRPLEEIQGRTHWDAYPGTENSEVGKLYKRALVEQQPVSLDHRYEWPNGLASWLEMRAFPVPEGLAVFWRDITERKEADAALRESELKYRGLFEMMTEGYVLAEVIYDDHGKPVDALYLEGNPSAARLTGIPHFNGRLLSEAMPGAEPFSLDICDRVARTGIAERTEQFASALGRWYELSVSPVAEVTREKDAPRKLAIVFTDVSERKRAEQALRKSEERFRALVTATSDIVYRMSPDWREMRQLEGRGLLRDALEPTQDWLADYIDAEDQAEVMAAIRQAISTKGVFELEHRVKRPDGTLGWVFSRAVPLVDDSGEIVEWFGAATDVTERHRTTEALIRTQRLETVSRLTGTVAHDFNNLLLVIMSNVEMAIMHAARPRQREVLETVLRMAEVGGKMSKRLLSWSGQNQPTLQDLDLNIPATEMADILGRTLARGFRVELRCAPEAAMVRADPAEIDAVLLNLVMNARDAMIDGGHITISTDILPVSGRAGRFVCLTVADTGAGMTEDVRAQACEPFFTMQPQGTGLGLFSVRETARKNDGFVELESTPGEGTIVRVFLPFAGQAEEEQEIGTGPDATILLVEDQDSVRQAMCQQLKALGYRVLEASNVADALHLLQKAEHVSLVFSDIMMPGEMDGRDLAQLVKTDWPGIAVLLTTGNTPVLQEKRRDDALAGLPILNKPYRMEELDKALRQALSGVSNSGNPPGRSA